ncbi:hypothetical protein C0992_011559 [Termitomyces sp. T32_za158]|nr:hypothetical protein C0992_011559 [Termitomyces sp. T32_za158]
MDVVKGSVTNSKQWYKVVRAPPEEEVDWLSPITSSYTLCATKTGKVVCWDVQTDRCLAEWSPGERWELWKCRVEFEEKTVYFTMAKVIVPRNDDTRLMDFVLMRLRFFDGNSGESADIPPKFEHVTEFKTRGVVMNVFLLDPIARLLSAFIYASGTNTICLYALLDWDKPEYIFIDTGIECVFTKTLVSKSDIPRISYRVSPAVTLHRKFVFPKLENVIHIDSAEPPTPVSNGTHGAGTTNGANGPALSSTSSNATPPLTPSTSDGTEAPTSSPPATPTLSTGPSVPPPPQNLNPYPFPPWCPDSAHFVRQWWPSLSGIPRVSCTVVLLAAHDPETHRTRFMLAQHYFRVPLSQGEWDPDVVSELTHKLVGPPHLLRAPGEKESTQVSAKARGRGKGKGSASPRWAREDEEEQDVDDAALMHLWYVDTPFEVVCVAETAEEPEDEDGETDRPRPLVAVDFGHAAWIEFVDNEDDPARPRTEDSDAKWLRFVTFPPFDESLGRMSEGEEPWAKTGGAVRTLETPPDLDLDMVETINIDQSQGAVILSVRDGMIFILCYE